MDNSATTTGTLASGDISALIILARFSCWCGKRLYAYHYRR
jgi:hypothetical protein